MKKAKLWIGHRLIELANWLGAYVSDEAKVVPQPIYEGFTPEEYRVEIIGHYAIQEEVRQEAMRRLLLCMSQHPDRNKLVDVRAYYEPGPNHPIKYVAKIAILPVGYLQLKYPVGSDINGKYYGERS